MKEADFLKYGRAKLDDRTVTELIGLASGVIADRVITQSEAEFLQKWLMANAGNPFIGPILKRLNDMLSDKVLDEEESKELLQTLTNLSGGDFELGALRRSAPTFFDSPVPEIEFEGKEFCFTGTFAYGNREECEQAVKNMGGSVGDLTKKTDYLVVGIYVTDSWVSSSLGGEIAAGKGLRYRHGRPVIVGEEDWKKKLEKKLISEFLR